MVDLYFGSTCIPHYSVGDCFLFLHSLPQSGQLAESSPKGLIVIKLDGAAKPVPCHKTTKGQEETSRRHVAFNLQMHSACAFVGVLVSVLVHTDVNSKLYDFCVLPLSLVRTGPVNSSTVTIDGAAFDKVSRQWGNRLGGPFAVHVFEGNAVAQDLFLWLGVLLSSRRPFTTELTCRGSLRGATAEVRCESAISQSGVL